MPTTIADRTSRGKNGQKRIAYTDANLDPFPATIRMARTPQLISLAALILLASTAMAQNPPVAPVRPVTDTHFGTKVTDPYRYMDDFHNAEVKAWVKAQA